MVLSFLSLTTTPGNTRFGIVSDPYAFADALFVCAQGKSAVHRIAQPVRLSGIPAAVIVDLDIIHSGWQKLLTALIPADDAIEVCTDGMTLDEVVDQLESLVRSKRP